MLKLRKKRKSPYSVIVLTLAFFIVIPNLLTPTNTRYYTEVTLDAIGKAKTTRTAIYTITFYSNGGEGTMSPQNVNYGERVPLTANAFTRTGYIFEEWNTESDGSGTSYSNKQQIYNLTSEASGNIELYAQWEDENAVAKIGNKTYASLQKAIAAVPTNNVETTIKLLKDTSEALTVAKGKNIVFNFQDFTISNSGTGNVIVNNGTITIYNGKIQTNVAQGAINNNSGAKLTMTGGKIISTGGRQAIYNDGGIAQISGTAYLSANAKIESNKNRGTVHNLNNGTLIITGGTIISTTENNINNTVAVSNEANMTIGVEDGTVNIHDITIQGKKYGIFSKNNFNFYDGTVKGETNAFNDESKVINKEGDYEIVHTPEQISNVTYDTAFLGHGITITFECDGGTLDTYTRSVIAGQEIGILPEPEKKDYVFLGWYTQQGKLITSNYVVGESNITLYARWREACVAKIGEKLYKSLRRSNRRCAYRQHRNYY